MTTILGTVVGFVASVLAEAIRLLRAKVEPPTQSSDGIPSPTDKTVPPVPESPDFRCLAFLRASVRPVITYAFFGLFAGLKILAFCHALSVDHASALGSLPVIWDENADALFGAVLGFWFGSRIISRQVTARR